MIPNDRLLSISDRNVSVLDAFKQADQVLLQGVSGITDLITTPGLINLDFADVKSVMANAGSALMGIGSARGEDRAVAAAEMAVSSPLLEASIDGAHGVLLSIAGGSDLGLFEINEAAALVQEAAHVEANIIFGATIDDALGDEVRVTVIAAGFDGGQPKRREDGHRGLRKPGQRPAQTQEETRAAAAAVATKREQPAEVEEKEKEPATAAAPAGQSRPESATKPAPAADAVRRRRPGHPRLPQVASSCTSSAHHGPVAVAFTDRRDGVSGVPFDSLNLAIADDDDPVARADNLRLVLDDFAPGAALADLHQVHGATVVAATGATGDAVRTPTGSSPTSRDLVLAVRAADCVPVLFADPERGSIGAAHCGRPGLAAGIVPRTVDVMRDQGAERITAWIGPHVCGGCYEVPAEMQDDVAAVVPEARADHHLGDAVARPRRRRPRPARRRGRHRRRRLAVHPRVARPLLLPPRRPPLGPDRRTWSYADERPSTGDRGRPGRRP